MANPSPAPEMVDAPASHGPSLESASTAETGAERARDGWGSRGTPLPAQFTPRAERRRRLWVELAVVLCLGVLPDLTNAVHSFILSMDGVRPDDRWTFPAWAIMSLVRSVQVGAVALFIMGRSGDGWDRFGVCRFRWWHIAAGVGILILTMIAQYAVGVGLWIFAPDFMEYLVDSSIIHDTGYVFPYPHGVGEHAMLVAMSAANAFAEEIVICAFLVTRFKELLNNPLSAVLLASACFASYHVYQGLYAVVVVFAVGLVQTSIFAASRRLWPIVVAHTLTDILIMWGRM